MIILGLGLYGIGALLWLFVLGRAPLSLAYPFVGIGFILTMLAGPFWLNASVSVARAAGTLMIAVGCVPVARAASIQLRHTPPVLGPPYRDFHVTHPRRSPPPSPFCPCP